MFQSSICKQESDVKSVLSSFSYEIVELEAADAEVSLPDLAEILVDFI
jgi:hypothetical protein